jgi:dTDP-4-dehydrorhamnose reductase
MIATNTIAVLDRFDRNGLNQKIRDHSGIFHLAGGGEASRFEWAKEILEKDPNHEEQIATELVPVQSTAFPTPAQRPKYTVLDCTKFEKTFNLSLPHWKTSLGEAMSGDLD